MNHHLVTALACIVALSGSARGATLEWVIPEGDRLEITRTARVQFLVNETVKKEYEERNIIDLTCLEKRDDAGVVRGSVRVYERPSAEEVFRLREEHRSRFSIGLNGRFDVPKGLYMPNLRHLPTFTGKDLAEGDAWRADAELVLDNFSRPFKLTFPVDYRLAGIEKGDGGDVAVIEYRFLIDMDLGGGKFPADFPRKILGRDDGTIRWDIANRRPMGMKERYRIVFIMQDEKGRAAMNEFRMEIDTAMKMYAPVDEDEKEKARDEIRKGLPEGVDVETEKRGLVIRLGDVLFDFDSAKLRDDSVKKLETIAGILREKYPDREIIVEGHTDSVGGRDYNARLSKDRAESVARYLKPRTGSDKLSYRGFGADRPIAENATGEGRQKNRRVEIIIKLR
jgi:outer membrane protein OmpA-like peptidoglycan-associated protein